MKLGADIPIVEYWRQVRSIQRGLPDVVHLISTPDPRIPESDRGGIISCEADSLTAAKCLFARTHRIAEPHEIVAQEKKRQTDLLELTRRHLAKQGIVAIQLPE